MQAGLREFLDKTNFLKFNVISNLQWWMVRERRRWENLYD